MAIKSCEFDKIQFISGSFEAKTVQIIIRFENLLTNRTILDFVFYAIITLNLANQIFYKGGIEAVVM